MASQNTPRPALHPPPTRATRNTADKRTPREWLDQFDPVDEAELGDNQRKFVEALRRQYSEGRAGFRRADGRLYFYASDSKLGYFAGLIPERRGDDIKP